jgi:hypothetical protein
MGEMRNTKFWLESLKGRDHSKDEDVDERIILRWIFWKYGFGYGLDSCGSGWEPVMGSCEHCNEPSGSIKGGGFLAS